MGIRESRVGWCKMPRVAIIRQAIIFTNQTHSMAHLFHTPVYTPPKPPHARRQFVILYLLTSHPRAISTLQDTLPSLTSILSRGDCLGAHRETPKKPLDALPGDDALHRDVWYCGGGNEYAWFALSSVLCWICSCSIRVGVVVVDRIEEYT